MVPRRRKIIWSEDALITRKNIFKYWNKRNKSTIYSKKLSTLFIEALNIVADFPISSVNSNKENVRLKLVRDFYLVYKISESEIVVLDIWDTRQNPENFPVK